MRPAATDPAYNRAVRLFPPQRRRVVITGIGVVSSNAIGAEAFTSACLEGRSGIVYPHDVDLTNLRTTAVAQALDFDPATAMDPAEFRRVPRMMPMAIIAAREALAAADYAIDPDDIERQRTIGVALGTGGGGMAFVEEQYRSLFTDGKASLFSITAGTHGNLSSEISIALHLRGPSHVLSTGCTSSTDAIGYAAMLIRTGVDADDAGRRGRCADLRRDSSWRSRRCGLISTRRWDDPSKASRPFSRDRDGFVLGEGAWMFVLEDREHAHAARRDDPRGNRRAMARPATPITACRSPRMSPSRCARLSWRLQDADARQGGVGLRQSARHEHAAERPDGDAGDAQVLQFARRCDPDELDQVDDRPSAGRVRRRGAGGDGAGDAARRTCIRRSISTRPIRNAIWIMCRTPRARWMWMSRCATASRLAARTVRWSFAGARRFPQQASLLRLARSAVGMPTENQANTRSTQPRCTQTR